jgi:hypothetical protein
VVKSQEFDTSIARRVATAITAALLAGLCAQSGAWGAEASAYAVTKAALFDQRSLEPGQSIITSRGPALVTGNVGSMATTMLPGIAGQGLLMNNGNGSSTLLVPGRVPESIITPR